MFWTVLWPLALGFLLSAAVETFVSKQAISRVLGRDGARPVAPGDALRRRVLVVLVRGGRGRQDAVPQGCDAPERDHLRVRVDQPRLRAGARARRPARLGVPRRRVRGGPAHGRAARAAVPADDDPAAQRARPAAGCARVARKDGRARRDGHVAHRWAVGQPPAVPTRADVGEPLLLHERVRALVGPAPRLPHRRRNRRVGAVSRVVASLPRRQRFRGAAARAR